MEIKYVTKNNNLIAKLYGDLGGGLMATSAGIAVSIGLSYLVCLFSSSKTKKF